MHATEAGLMDDILANPGVDGLRLILADWLEENGQDERAEFIRVQLEIHWNGTPLHPRRPEPSLENDRRQDWLFQRQSEILERHAVKWILGAMPAMGGHAFAGKPMIRGGCVYSTDGHGDFVVFNRGLVNQISMGWPSWRMYGGDYVETFPLTAAWITGACPEQQGGTWSWFTELDGAGAALLPRTLYNRLRKTPNAMEWMEGRRMIFWDANEAHAALSAALLHYGNELKAVGRVARGARAKSG